MAQQTNDSSADPFQQLKERIHTRLKAEKLDDQIFGMVQDAYLKLLKAENIILSRQEQHRLLRAILKDELNDMLARM